MFLRDKSIRVKRIFLFALSGTLVYVLGILLQFFTELEQHWISGFVILVFCIMVLLLDEIVKAPSIEVENVKEK